MDEANEGFEKVASYGLLQNMILYLMSDYGLGLVKGQNVLFMWVAATNFMPLVGAFLSDSYLGRFLTISIASLSSFLVIKLHRLSKKKKKKKIYFKTRFLFFFFFRFILFFFVFFFFFFL